MNNEFQRARPPVLHEWLFIIAIGLLSFNLHASITATDPLLRMIGQSLGISMEWSDPFSWMPIGFLALAALLAPRLVKSFPMWKIALIAQIVGLCGIFWRCSDGATGLFGGLILNGLGLGLAGCIVPGLIKKHFSVRPQIYMGFYSAMIDLGMMMATAVTLPIALTYGSWRLGLGIWSIPLVLGIIVWVIYFRFFRIPDRDELVPNRFAQIIKQKIGWDLTFLYAVRVGKSYLFAAWIAILLQGRGFVESDAKFIMAMSILAQIPSSLFANYVAQTMGGAGRLIATCSVITAITSWLIFYTPNYWTLPLAMVLGFCSGAVFSRGLGLMLEHAGNTSSAICLSGMVQGFGYCIGAGGAFLLGQLIDPQGNFWIFCLIYTILTAFSIMYGLICGRPGKV